MSWATAQAERDRVMAKYPGVTVRIAYDPTSLVNWGLQYHDVRRGEAKAAAVIANVLGANKATAWGPPDPLTNGLIDPADSAATYYP